jgi:hypothetical protein
VVSILLRRKTVIVDVGPILNMDIADVSTPPSQTLVQPLSLAPDPSTPASPNQQIQVDVSAIDDSGIVSLKVQNAGFEVIVWRSEGSDPTTVPEQATPKPIQRPTFVAQRVAVNLVAGKNDIRAIAVNGQGQQVMRSVEVVARIEAPAEIPVDMMIVAAIHFAALPDNQLLPQASQRITELITHEGSTLPNGSSLPNGSRALMLVGADATRDQGYGKRRSNGLDLAPGPGVSLRSSAARRCLAGAPTSWCMTPIRRTLRVRR